MRELCCADAWSSLACPSAYADTIKPSSGSSSGKQHQQASAQAAHQVCKPIQQGQHRLCGLHRPEPSQQVAAVGLLAQIEHHQLGAHLAQQAGRGREEMKGQEVVRGAWQLKQAMDRLKVMDAKLPAISLPSACHQPAISLPSACHQPARTC